MALIYGNVVIICDYEDLVIVNPIMITLCVSLIFVCGVRGTESDHQNDAFVVQMSESKFKQVESRLYGGMTSNLPGLQILAVSKRSFEARDETPKGQFKLRWPE